MSNTALQLATERSSPQSLQRQISGLQLNSLDDLQTIGQIFVKSGFFSDATDAAKAIVKVMAGAELGFLPIASMTGVYIVKGKISLSANLIAAAIKRSGKYTYRVKQLDDTGCVIEFFESGARIGDSSFTRDDAQRAGLMASDTWKKFFRNMVFARAMSNGAKWHCADIFGGPIYTPDELGAQIDGETGEVIETQALPVASAAPAVELVAAETLITITELWARHGQKQGAGVEPLADYLHRKKQLGSPAEMPASYAMQLLDWLEGKAAAAAQSAPTAEPEAVEGEIIEPAESPIRAQIENIIADLESLGCKSDHVNAKIAKVTGGIYAVDELADDDLPKVRQLLQRYAAMGERAAAEIAKEGKGK